MYDRTFSLLFCETAAAGSAPPSTTFQKLFIVARPKAINIIQLDASSRSYLHAHLSLGNRRNHCFISKSVNEVSQILA